MRVGRFLVEGEPRYGFVTGDEVAFVADASGGEGPALSDRRPMADVTLLAPAQPTKVVAVGLNYRDHAAELGMDIPDAPLIFLKPASSVIGPGAPIIMPPTVTQVDHEAELAVVIGRRCRHATAGDALEYVLGYTCGNDVTARDLQKLDGQWTRAKSFDTFCPLGPWIETELDPGDLSIEAVVGETVRQSSRTSQMIFGVAELVAFVSDIMTLEAGDVIMTGTPPGVGPLADGETVSIRIEGIGELANPVVGG